jgi:hypothetical protein
MMVFHHVKEVEDIDLTNQPFKRSKICPVIPKGEAMIHLALSATFPFACKPTDILPNSREENYLFQNSAL